MKNLCFLLLSATILGVFGCTSSEVSKFMKGVSEATLTDEDVSEGLKAALIKGISEGAESASKENGFYGNDLIRIGLPEEVQKVENTIRRIGFGSELDKVHLTINRGAENAALEAKPIFINAIKQLTLKDAWDILRGEDDAATQYLRKTTSGQLAQLFEPHIQESLNKVGATRYYGEIVNTYNAFPTTTNKLNPDLKGYVTERAIDGLFKLIAQEEKAIRENPAERTSAILKRVFAAQDQ
ncbi:DUF4197 domain-containing protein [Echinicola jeungdonensis]|uniref:DUF4197 domain-containing protein n=1 Tax=Echinicola jeungdonensis TaxID=709343 RepID=A0ABV5J2K3_9BACT|nr:DUF4197 domain-containing protein [Echinicola jeungdonensis]MDN3668589.1 DUF4197 domain-containing protein [Echinicola jeungdonensis]